MQIYSRIPYVLSLMVHQVISESHPVTPVNFLEVPSISPVQRSDRSVISDSDMYVIEFIPLMGAQNCCEYPVNCSAGH